MVIFQGSDISDTRAVVALARSGMISNEVETFALEDIGEAYRRLAEGSVQGRAVVNP